MAGCPADPKKIIMKLHANWGHASAQQLNRVVADADGEKFRINVMSAAPSTRPRTSRLRQCPQYQCLTQNCDQICYFWAILSPRARRTSLPSTPFSSPRVQKLLRNCRARPAACGLASLVTPRVFRLLRAVSGRMKLGRTEESARRIRPSTQICSERMIRLKSQGTGAHPRIVERRNGLAHGIHNRLVADYRCSDKQISPKVQWCLNTLIPGGGYSVSQLVFRFKPVGLFGWGDSDEYLLFAQANPPSGQLVRKWKLRMTSQEASHKEVANGKLRRLLGPLSPPTAPTSRLGTR